MANTLFLNKDTWDLELDASNQIAMTSGPYGIAQNVANAVRLFTNDAYFMPDDGIPHFAIDLGKQPPEAVLRAKITQAAQAVEGVATAVTTFSTFEGRTLEGNIQITTNTGDVINVAI